MQVIIQKSKWINKWKNSKNLAKNQNNEKFYVLAMFPYPSGMLHMGHVRVYTISDTLARFRKMLGYNVIHPMGWDAFGLPAENAAMERGIHPADWTISNISSMKKQMERILADFDWDREVTTCNPDYYKWTQYLFLQMYKERLAYQKEAIVNWDPVDQTVLANEQVDSDGRSWRSGAKVERRKLKQWFFKITDFAESLLNDLDSLDKWPDYVKQMQRNWIGKSKGAEFDFIVESKRSEFTVKVFTSRPDTIFGVQYLAISIDHPLLSEEWLPQNTCSQVLQFVKNIRQQQSFELNDVNTGQGMHTGVFAKHPITGLSIPIYVASYVVPDYGTGAVMGVPAHDERDWEFVKVNRIISEENIKKVIMPVIQDNSTQHSNKAFTLRGILTAECGQYAGLSSDNAEKAIVENAQKAGYGRWSVQVVPVPESELPVLLPTNVTFSGRGGSPLKQVQEWITCKCPKCQGPAIRDTDTMDTFVDSSWYFMRYTDSKNSNQPFCSKKASNLLPVDVYIGGIEHANLHLLYSRFFTKFMFKQGMYTGQDEPFKQLGMVHGKTFKDPISGRFLKPDEVDLSDPNKPIQISTGIAPVVSFEKMSKSKYNGVDPETTINNYGADATRLHILFKAPVSEVLEWEDASIVGMQRWIARVWRLAENVSEKTSPANIHSLNSNLNLLNKEDKETYRIINVTIKEVTADYKSSTFNTAVSSLIKLTNHLTSISPFQNENASKNSTVVSPIYEYGIRTLVKMMAPMAPSIGEEFWEILNKGKQHTTSVFEELWPEVNTECLSANEVTCVVQINGKMRFSIMIPSTILQDNLSIEKLILDSESGKKWIGKINADKKIKKVIHANGGKIVNFVFDKH
ncbi:21693_t:CDS:10 [Dentiscutata erythropus]|uniref:leucine--tRNA ligase n=1 Tax=Dentiscutata erythropus TaxID=1348616 RepID=A0A9N8VT84_9GLOM|nr:21693_t:CDS:10 [Dentiscutata erythropus]